MAARGPYAKGVAKRAEILDTALELIARVGYSGTTVRELADAVGLSPNGLLHYFESKDELFTEILRRRDEVDQTRYGINTDPAPDLSEDFIEFVRHNAAVPGLVHLYLRLSNEAVEKEHPSHNYFVERYETIREAHRENFERLQAQGDLSTDLDPDKLAVILIALGDGLQTQWMYDEKIDMAEHTAYLMSLLSAQNRD